MFFSSLFCSLFTALLFLVILTDHTAKLHKSAVEHLLFNEELEKTRNRAIIRVKIELTVIRWSETI